MGVRLYELSGFQRDLLYVIAGFDYPSGQRIATELESDGCREVTHGQLYPNLDALVEEGLVEKGRINRRTNFYSLTDAGKQSLRARRAWENEFFDPARGAETHSNGA